MTDTTAPPRHLALILAAIVGTAGALRIFLPWSSVFAENYVSFLETDAWYHMRLVDALVANFPWRLWHDPYLVHPGGEPVNAGPVFDWIIAAVALVLGGGSPSERLIDVVGACTPPVIGALTVVPVFVLGRELWSARAGLWAAFMVAVMPGQLLERSLLGFTDHHCLETLLSTTTMMCVVVALKRDATSARRWALAGGVSLGAYLLTWGGGVLFVAFIVAWAGLQLMVDAFRPGRARSPSGPNDVTRVVGPVLLVAAVMVAPWARARPYFAYQFAALVGGVLAIWALHACQGVGRRLAWGRARWAATIAAVAVGAGVVARVVLGDHVGQLLADASRISPFRQAGFVTEAQPLFRSPMWYPVPLWKEFTTSMLLAVLAAGMWVREWMDGLRAPWYGIFAVWSLTMLGATVGQVRFTYYLGINVALLGGLACVRLMERLGDVTRLTSARRVALMVITIAIAAPGAPRLAGLRAPAPSVNPNWYDALTWLRTSTPEPFATTDAYLRPPHDGRPSSYGVLAWWDYGYWITRVARRAPISNPRQTGVQQATAIFLATSPEDASRVMAQVGARYVVVNWQLQMQVGRAQGGFFGGMAIAAGQNPRDYCDQFARRHPATGEFGAPEMYCYPEYFRTMAMRLYLHGGRAAEPPGAVTVVASQPASAGRRPIREVTDEWSFATYDEAMMFIRASGRADVRVVSKSLQTTCVPLEAVVGYRQVFRSLDQENGLTGPPVVQIFEYRAQTR